MVTESVAALLDNLNDDSLVLDLSGKTLTEEDVKSVRDKLALLPRIKEVRLSKCGLNNKKIEMLLGTLVRHPGITHIDLSRNPISNYASLRRLVTGCPHLIALDLAEGTSSDIDQASVLQLIQSILQTDQLTSLGLPQPIFSLTPSGEETKLAREISGLKNLGEFHTTNNDSYLAIVNAATQENHAAVDKLFAVLDHPDESGGLTSATVDAILERMPLILARAEENGGRAELVQTLERLNFAGIAGQLGCERRLNRQLFVTSDGLEATDGTEPQPEVPVLVPSQRDPNYQPMRSTALNDAVMAFLALKGVTHLDGDPLAVAVLPPYAAGLGKIEELGAALKAKGITLTPDDFARLGPNGKHAFYETKKTAIVLAQIMPYFLRTQGGVFSLDAFLITDKDGDVALQSLKKAGQVLFDADFWRQDPQPLMGLLPRLGDEARSLAEACLRQLGALGPAPKAPKAKESGLAGGFQPLRSRDFENTLLAYANERHWSSNNDPLNIAASKQSGGVPSLHLLADYVKQQVGFDLAADHFCQTKGVLGGDVGRAAYTYESGQADKVQTILQFVKERGLHFSVKGLLSVDAEGQTFIDVCRKHGLLRVLFDDEAWRGNETTLAELAEKDLPLDVKRSIGLTLSKLTGRPLQDPPPRAFSLMHDRFFAEAMAEVEKALGLGTSSHPLTNIAEQTSGVALLHRAAAMLYEKTGYHLEADDFLRVMPGNKYNIFSKNANDHVAHMMAYLKETGQHFSREIFEVVNDERRHPVESVFNYNVAAIFFDDAYWKDDIETLRFLSMKTDNWREKEVIETCLRRITGEEPPADAVPALSVDDWQEVPYDPEHDMAFKTAINDFQSERRQSFGELIIAIAADKVKNVTLDDLNAYMSAKIGRRLQADDSCRKNGLGNTSFSYGRDLTGGGLARLMDFLTEQGSVFSLKALTTANVERSGESGSVDRKSPLDRIYELNLENVFFRSDYWQMSPETLRALQDIDPRFNGHIRETLNEIDQIPPGKRRRPMAPDAFLAAPAAPQVNAIEGLARVKAIYEQIQEPSLAELYKELQGKANDTIGLFAYGDRMLSWRDQLLAAEMEITRNARSGETVAGLMVEYNKRMADANQYVENTVQRLKADEQTKPTRNEGGFLTSLMSWSPFAKKVEEEHIEATVGTASVKAAGQTLQQIPEILAEEERADSEDLAVLATVIEAYKKVNAGLTAYIAAGKAFLADDPPVEVDAPEKPLPSEPEGPALASDGTIVAEIVEEEGPATQGQRTEPTLIAVKARPTEMNARYLGNRLAEIEEARNFITMMMGKRVNRAEIQCATASLRRQLRMHTLPSLMDSTIEMSAAVRQLHDAQGQKAVALAATAYQQQSVTANVVRGQIVQALEKISESARTALLPLSSPEDRQAIGPANGHLQEILLQAQSPAPTVPAEPERPKEKSLIEQIEDLRHSKT
jgi:hypothetical protein